MKKVLKWAALVVGFVILFAAGYGLYLYHSVKETAEQIFEQRTPSPPMIIQAEPVSAENAKPGGGASNLPSSNSSLNVNRIQVNRTVDLDKKEPFTVLVLGVDQRENDRGRSDAMILLSVNPERKSILMFNIPRDTRTAIAGRGTVDKINHAYAFGGVDMSVSTVEELLQYPVHYYVKVNMEGFSKIIDTLGGVQVNNSLAFDYGGYHFASGNIHLDGSQALAFSRMRFDDPRGDLGRNARQREIVKEVIRSALNVSTVFKLNSLLNEVGSNVRTDISFNDMKTLVADYRQDLNTIEQIEIKGTGSKIGGIWYYIVDANERQRIHTLLAEHMKTLQ
ncbi:LCP family protein [Paenibacillus lemnae]|uniref:Cell envelope-related transcriptional attenuator domain-containing protein n=1 Tax=Paenibacillus lemnae TaxID=1330551 RepID=A0A848M3T8_PAELE|nr:LCP family protein [Paenibacillus lemnae]NMO95698.1 hypothetical protein [Paenibacillus lemnae]